MIEKYGQLKSAIANWLARNDLENQIEDFIWLAESRINKDLFCPEMYKTKITKISNPSPDISTQCTILVPDNLIKLKSISYIDINRSKVKLLPCNENVINNYSFNFPKYFERRGSYFAIFPNADFSNFDFVIDFYERIPSLSKTNTTNWLLEQSPEIYLYASLLEACPYLGEDSRVNMWLSAYNIGVSALNASSNNKQYGELLDYTYYGGP